MCITYVFLPMCLKELLTRSDISLAKKNHINLKEWGQTFLPCD